MESAMDEYRKIFSTTSGNTKINVFVDDKTLKRRSDAVFDLPVVPVKPKKQKKRDPSPSPDLFSAAITASLPSFLREEKIKEEEKEVVKEVTINSLKDEVENHPTMNEEQKNVMRAVLGKANVFVTGSGGTGKSFLIETINDYFCRLNKTVELTAPTGVAALLVGGKTLHSFMKMGLASRDPSLTLDQDLAKHLDLMKAQEKKMNKTTAARCRATDLLIIDEISMVDPQFLRKIDHTFRFFRKSDKPFGGVQLICLGDFFQLPPVRKFEKFGSSSEDTPAALEEPKYVFELKEWKSYFTTTIVLSKIYRQKDTHFVELLNRARWGVLTATDIFTLEQRINAPLVHDTSITPTILTSYKKDAEEINVKRLAELDSPIQYFEASRSYMINPMTTKKNSSSFSTEVVTEEMKRRRDDLYDQLQKNCLAEPRIALKVGAAVMLVVNLCPEKGLVNGSQGVVRSFSKFFPFAPTVEFDNGVKIQISAYSFKIADGRKGFVVYEQIPLMLAWALTTHKVQGISINYLQTAIDKTFFEYGQSYMCLSRCSSLEGLTLSRFYPNVIRADPKVVAFYRSIGVHPPSSV